MQNDSDLVTDSRFRSLLSRRARWRWGMSGTLIGAYLVWGVAGLYFPNAYATPVPGSAVPWGMAVGILIIVASIIGSIVYVKIVNRIEAEEMTAEGRDE